MNAIKFMTLLFGGFFILVNSLVAADNIQFPEGRIESPFEACKDIVIVSQKKYLNNKSSWDKVEKTCNLKIQLSVEAGFTSIDPLKEGVQYLSLGQKVAEKVVNNLKKNRAYAECSASCFSGALTCPDTDSSNKKVTKCDERKTEIKEAMKVYGRKIRMELALSTDAPGAVNVTVRNALEFSKDSYHKDKFINSNLRAFEAGLPNPVGGIDLSEREFNEAKRRLALDHKKLESEFKEKGSKNYSDWMSVKLMEKMDDHKARYRELIYQEAPIFSVIEKPIKSDKGEDPQWSDAQISKAFLKLSENTKTTEEKVNWSLKNSKLEFSRMNGEALGKWISNLAPGSKEKNDLLYYMGMKNPVEEVLKDDRSLCGVATSMDARFHSKEMQNAGIILAGAMVSGGILKGSTSVGSSLFRIGRALTGAEAAGVTGLGLGASLVADSFRQFNSVTTEIETKSGLSDKEAKPIRKSDEVTLVRDGVKTSMLFLPLDVAGGWAVGKTIYSALSKQMARDLPEMSALVKKAKLDNVARDRAVDSWLSLKLKLAIENGVLNNADKAAISAQKGHNVLEALSGEIEKFNPEFFNNPKNIDYFLKTAATIAKKEKDDLPDLGEKVQQLLFHLNAEALSGSWNPKGQSALLKVFDNAIEELRLSAKNDPETYIKFSSNEDAQNKIFIRALKRSGAKDEDLPSMVQCALPR